MLPRRSTASWPPDATVHGMSQEAIRMGCCSLPMLSPVLIASCDTLCTVPSGGQDAAFRLHNKVRLLVRARGLHGGMSSAGTETA